MGNPNYCFMIIAVTFFSPANRRGELCDRINQEQNDYGKSNIFCLAILRLLRPAKIRLNFCKRRADILCMHKEL